MILSSSFKNASKRRQVNHPSRRAFPANPEKETGCRGQRDAVMIAARTGLHARHESCGGGYANRTAGEPQAFWRTLSHPVNDVAAPQGRNSSTEGIQRARRAVRRDQDLDQSAKQRQELAAPAVRAGFRMETLAASQKRRAGQWCPGDERFSAIFSRLPGIHPPVRPGGQKGSLP